MEVRTQIEGHNRIVLESNDGFNNMNGESGVLRAGDKLRIKRLHDVHFHTIDKEYVIKAVHHHRSVEREKVGRGTRMAHKAGLTWELEEVKAEGDEQ